MAWSDEAARRRQLNRYNISESEMDDILKRQDGRCAICRKEPDQGKRRLCVDHDHACCDDEAQSCGRCVRGLLCFACNNGLRKFRDRPDLLLAAANYLEEHHT